MWFRLHHGFFYFDVQSIDRRAAIGHGCHRSRFSKMNRSNMFFAHQCFFLLLTFIIISTLPGHCDGFSKTNNSNARPEARAITHRASAVFALMESMRKKNAFAIRILEQDPSYLNLDQRDRSFARLLLSTAERRSGQIEIVIKSFERKEKKKPNAKVSVGK